MKRLSFFSVSISILILVALGVWFVNRPKPIQTSSPVASISNTFPDAQSALPSLLVTPITSNVAVALLEKPSSFSKISTPTQVVEGSHVKTDATGRALIEGVNTTVLDSNTEITLATLDAQQNKTRLRLEVGNVWSRVKKLSDKGEFYEIETQTARASVRGTSFGLNKKRGVTTLYVVEGMVRFGTIPPKTDESIQYSDANVGAGKKAVLYDGDFAPVVSDITLKDRQDPWFIFNNPSVGAPPSSKDLVQTSVVANTVESIISTPTEINRPVVETVQPAPVVTSPPVEIVVPVAPVVELMPNRTITPATQNSPELLLSSIFPNSIVAGVPTTLKFSGSGFVKAGVFTVLIGNTRMTSFSVVSDSVIQVNVGSGQFVGGDYDVTIEGTSNTVSTLSPGLTVTRAPIVQVPLR